MCCPPKMTILKYMRKNSPLEKHNETKMDGIKQGEMNQQNNCTQYIYNFTSAGNSVLNTKIVAHRESNMPGCRSLDTFVGGGCGY
jgi:hypothetical protein